MRSIERAGALVMSALLTACGGGGSSGPHGTAPVVQATWVRAWDAPPQFVYPNGFELGYATAPALTAGTLGSQTIRTRVTLSAASKLLRVTFNNTTGTSALQITAATIAVASAATGPALASNATSLTFTGSAGTSVAAGGVVTSDPIPFVSAPGTVLAVSMAIGAPIGAITWHADGEQSAYVSSPGSGDQTAELSGASYATRISSRLFVSAIDVQGTATQTVVAFGDSQTDGRESGVDADARYPDVLAQRLNAAGMPFAIANAGISGDVVSDAPCQSGLSTVNGGPPGVTRFAQDALGVPNLRAVIVLEGINDIGACNTSAAMIVAALQTIITQAHLAGARVIGATILPAGGDTSVNYGSPAGEATREAVNAFIRGGAFDAVADFDAALRDPADPTRLASAYDSGDHLHPNAAGYALMANTVNLSTL